MSVIIVFVRFNIFMHIQTSQCLISSVNCVHLDALEVSGDSSGFQGGEFLIIIIIQYRILIHIRTSGIFLFWFNSVHLDALEVSGAGNELQPCTRLQYM